MVAWRYEISLLVLKNISSTLEDKFRVYTPWLNAMDAPAYTK